MHYNIYCDESCHLQNDDSNIMVLGAMYCLEENKNRIFQEIRDLKVKHNLDSYFEIKWTKVSESKIDFYLELLEYFLRCDDLFYRVLIAKDKDKLDHATYNNNDYDEWYYKMYFNTLDPIIKLGNKYNIMLDIKDTKGGPRVRKLHDVLCNNIYDFNGDVISQVTQINSKESEILQLADLINGSISYFHRNLHISEKANQGKVKFLEQIQKSYDLNKTSLRNEEKFNLFIWSPKGVSR